MERTHATTSVIDRSTCSALLPFMSIVFFCYLPVGFAFGALPPFVHGALALGPAAVGWAMALQSVATVLTRGYAGRVADDEGAKRAIVTGAWALLLSACLCAVAAVTGLWPWFSFAILMMSRIALGLAESLVMTGALSAAIAAVGVARSGLAMVWIGIVLFAGIAAGAPAGAHMLGLAGLSGVALASVVAGLGVLAVGISLRHVPRFGGLRPPFMAAAGTILPYGMALGLSTVGYGALLTFLPLDYATNGWAGASWGVAVFGAAYILGRLLLGHLPDRVGGYRVVAVALPVQAAGFVLLWLAGTPVVALAGAAVAGSGYALTFPALGVEAVRHVHAHSRGTAMGAYVAFIDIGLALTGPAGGWVVSRTGYPSIFLVSAVLSLCGLAICFKACRVRR
ncbi:MFS transporter [Paraburkholderia ferrariae]|jgi:predicted MFS family arabinose efflux permease|uniref:MFS transporter n=1 Tax=Paraburkholderia ferrariae TaxID=386056 RepID=UPI0005AB493D|nr:MFS transporter [Paraburkholderia ferrariae]